MAKEDCQAALQNTGWDWKDDKQCLKRVPNGRAFVRKLGASCGIKGARSMSKQELCPLLVQKFATGLSISKPQAWEVLNEAQEQKVEKADDVPQLAKQVLGVEGGWGIVTALPNGNVRKEFKDVGEGFNSEGKRTPWEMAVDEFTYQKRAAAAGVAPKPIALEKGPPITMEMERLDMTVVDYLKNVSNGILTDDQQLQIRGLYETLDRIGVYHNDANPLNLMWRERDNRFFLIDYGFSKAIEEKHGPSPNVESIDLLLDWWLMGLVSRGLLKSDTAALRGKRGAAILPEVPESQRSFWRRLAHTLEQTPLFPQLYEDDE